MASTGSCAHCGKSSTLRCIHLEQDASNTTTFYCSRECQTTHWPTHKKSCLESKDRKKLHRAGELLKDLVYVFQKITCPLAIEKAEINDTSGKIHLYTGRPTWHNYTRQFHSHLTELQYQGVVSIESCVTMLTVVLWLPKIILGSSFTSVQMHHISAKPDCIHVAGHEAKRFNANGTTRSYYAELPPSRPHIAFSVRLRDGVEYVIDPCGAMHYPGFIHPVVRPFDDYARDIIYKIVKTESLAAAVQESGPCDVTVSNIMAQQFGQRIQLDLKKPDAQYSAAKTQLIQDFHEFGDQRFAPYQRLALTRKPNLSFDMKLQRGKAECLWFQVSSLPASHETIVQGMRQRYGQDDLAERLAKRARETLADDDFAEVGHRCIKLAFHLIFAGDLDRGMRASLNGVYESLAWV